MADHLQAYAEEFSLPVCLSRRRPGGARGIELGCELRHELAATHRTALAGRDTGRIPITPGGPVHRVMSRLLTADTRLGRRFAAGPHAGYPAGPGATGGPPPGRGPPRRPVAGVVDGRPRSDGGGVPEVAAANWCTG
jgi:hypothetical protein